MIDVDQIERLLHRADMPPAEYVIAVAPRTLTSAALRLATEYGYEVKESPMCPPECAYLMLADPHLTTHYERTPA